MTGWYRITFNTNGWDENKDIICNVIKPVVETLEESGDIINFFFFEYFGGAEQNVKFTYYGNKGKVLTEFKKYIRVRPEQNPFGENYRRLPLGNI